MCLLFQHPLNTWQRSMSAEMLDEDDFEVDDDQWEMAMLANSTMSNESSFLSEFQEATSHAAHRDEDKEVKKMFFGRNRLDS